MIFQSTILIAAILIKCSLAYSPFYENFWVIWNVGQDQWVTHVLPDRCIHYDVGGEPHYFKTIRRSLIVNCANKENEINLSHWDFDHYENIPTLARLIAKICWQIKPFDRVQKKSATQILNLNIPNCRQLAFSQYWLPDRTTVKNTNDSSIVHLDSNVLIPGDSSISQEKIWINRFNRLNQAQILILGHHGSRTSTGKKLLTHLPFLKMAIASARYKKYGHPHQRTLNSLQHFHISMLKTEDWGNIWLSL